MFSYFNRLCSSILLCYFWFPLCSIDVNGEEIVLSRYKRYLAYPEDAAFTVSICVTIGAIGNPYYSYLSYALNWGVAYHLPNETWVLQHAHGFGAKKNPEMKTEMQRRARRDIYNEISVILESMGYDGRECVLRAICESRKYFESETGTMEEMMIKTIFSLPLTKIMSRYDRDIHLYDDAYRTSRDIDECSQAYPRCGFSLLALAFGKHSENFYNM